MQKRKRAFESGHPDIKTPAQCGKQKKELAHLAQMDYSSEFIFGLGGEIPNSKNQTKMIKSVEMKMKGKKWYVEYYELNPNTNTWDRHRESGGVNRELDPVKRRELLQDLCNEIMSAIVTRTTNLKAGESEIYNYILAYQADKANSLRKTSLKNIKLALTYFYDFLKTNNYHLYPLHHIRKQHIHEFRTHLSTFTSNRSVNGHFNFVSSFFNYFINNYDDILYKNPCAGFKKLPTMSETHVAYTQDQVQKCFAYMQENDPYLLLYVKFVGLGFVRCEETRHLRISDIDFNRKTITLTAGYSKTRMRVIKPLLDKFFDDLITAKIYNYPANYYIFTEAQRPGEVLVGKNYFRKRFKKVKEALGLSAKHTIYSFRHTFVSQLLDNGAKWHKVMQYTGHTTMEAFSHYARSLHVKPTEDLSHFLNH